MLERIRKHLERRNVEIPKYGLLYFDHLHGEFSLIEGMDPQDKAICDRVLEKRKNRLLTWDDIYSYQLILLKYQDFETLKSKIISLRIKYQNLLDIAEYNSYIALRAVDLTRVTNTEEDNEKLRADYKYLLDEFYLRYAYASTREDLRTRLLRYAALFTLSFFILAVIVGVFSSSSMFSYQSYWTTYIRDTYSTLFVVCFAGIMGAFVSMQQRLQTISHHGDPVYNLSLLTHGWFSIFLSPISGAIFAALLYLFFSGKLLEGTIFPTMSTPAQSESILGLAEFAFQTGPKTGKDFALLIIWSFIAGFAERFVPDTLMRLVNQKKVSETAQA
jgi:hypothetical protein